MRPRPSSSGSEMLLPWLPELPLSACLSLPDGWRLSESPCWSGVFGCPSSSLSSVVSEPDL
jgi:hypothetical protein